MKPIEEITTSDLILELTNRSDVLLLFAFKDGTYVDEGTNELSAISVVHGSADWLKAVQTAVGRLDINDEDKNPELLSEDFQEFLAEELEKLEEF